MRPEGVSAERFWCVWMEFNNAASLCSPLFILCYILSMTCYYAGRDLFCIIVHATATYQFMFLAAITTSEAPTCKGYWVPIGYTIRWMPKLDAA